ncbi:haloacid dehalogenase [Persicimonas caeni]|uniref:Haloacid dehalogenase n=1 Tax=Persicimonas caeni TaxID=2292766 RepID=A0A4Y6Q281_PERCE|nr:HAD hydrolase-like protein [Persicimonas caeni]QDG54095.1 haloacid dehalogenase [Persicimonas caeni]QED35316.1 haloacid dehalogenase [Persicimonas caeni]
MSRPAQIALRDLYDNYDGLLIDAYGVLVHTSGAFDGAVSFMQSLSDRALPYVVITNDASRLPESCAAKYQRDGLDIRSERIVTSGSLVIDYFEEHNLHGARCLVLGPPDSKRYAERAGGELVDVDHGDFDVLIIGDESGYDFVPTTDKTLTTLFRKLDRGDDFELLLPNPDLIYQRSATSFGFTSGSVANLFENAIRARYPGCDICFERLGKPFAPMFDEAIERLGTRNCAVLGDQLETDIKGANDYGLDSVLVATGLTDLANTLDHSDVRPDFILPSLDEA